MGLFLDGGTMQEIESPLIIFILDIYAWTRIYFTTMAYVVYKKKITNKAKAISAELLELNFKNKLEETWKTR